MNKLLSFILLIGFSCSFSEEESPLPSRWFDLSIVNNYDFECEAVAYAWNYGSGFPDDRKCEYLGSMIVSGTGYIPPNSAAFRTLYFESACSNGEIIIKIYNKDSLVYQTELLDNGEDKILTVP